MDDIRIDGVALPLHVQAESRVAKLARLNNVDFKCGQLSTPGICGSQPCHNGGSCSESETEERGYTCTCSARFTGAHCEYDQDPCASSPCLFEAKCVNLRNDYHCECPPKLSGKRCHYGKYCNPNPCHNGGMCEEGAAGPICKCRGFTGTYCTVDINECLHNNPCQNSGTCINSNGGFHCVCPQGVSGPYCSDILGKATGRNDDFAFKLEEMVAIIVGSLFLFVIIIALYIGCKRCRSAVKHGRNNSNGAAYHIQNEFDKDSMAMHRVRGSDYNNREQKLNNLELAAQDSRPLIPPTLTRPMSSFMQNQHETAFNYAETVRSYGSAADELETATLPRLPHDYIQNIQKPMAAVAPSICCHPSDHETLTVGGGNIMMHHHHPHMSDQRNLMDSYFYPNKPGGKRSPPRPTSFRPPSRLRVNLPASATDSPGLKGATSLSSLPTSNTEDTQKYYWDSFDLNGTEEQEQHPRLIPEVNIGPEVIDNSSFVSSESNENNLLLLQPTKPPPVGRPVDPTRDIDTLPEDDTMSTLHNNNNDNDDVISNAGTEDEPQLGAVYPQAANSNSLEQLLSLNDDINFADEEDDDGAGHEAQNSYDYHLHLNNYLPQHNISEASETDEQTPMLGRRESQIAYQGLSATTSPNSNFRRFPPSPVRLIKPELDVSSDYNRSISALPEEPFRRKAIAVAPPTTLRLPNYNNLSAPPPSSSNGMSAHGELDNLCQLEESEDDDDCQTPTVEMRGPPSSNPNLPRVTQV